MDSFHFHYKDCLFYGDTVENTFFKNTSMAKYIVNNIGINIKQD